MIWMDDFDDFALADYEVDVFNEKRGDKWLGIHTENHLTWEKFDGSVVQVFSGGSVIIYGKKK